MLYDVPMLQVVSLEHNIFTDQRVSLGYSNLQSSFITNGGTLRSADSGRDHTGGRWELDAKPGAPV